MGKEREDSFQWNCAKLMMPCCQSDIRAFTSVCNVLYQATFFFRRRPRVKFANNSRQARQDAGDDGNGKRKFHFMRRRIEKEGKQNNSFHKAVNADEEVVLKIDLQFPRDKTLFKVHFYPKNIPLLNRRNKSN